MKNPKIYDDKALFGADHKNLLKTGTGITKEAVQAMPTTRSSTVRFWRKHKIKWIRRRC